ncbi:chorismate mutase II [Geomicrobium sp. JCM 19037]|uniref:chorismate mutase n=1 Tax=Geomicrobium sp. JCM 19037 TaxID=1460634 RepID=UPI00045F30BB|nr:chorismate mutase [Geomicrobium sp. JCM 19037]GAK02422.1 chorismate mutase II [Geomicrobium sp. JCM 19037]
MIRGIRGATTIDANNDEEIWSRTKDCLQEMVTQNDIRPEDVAHIWFTVTPDINAAFPAKAARLLEDPSWAYVPVMCATEIGVPDSLNHCIRVMMSVNSSKNQVDIHHVFQNDAVKLRPDLVQGIDKSE